MPRPDNFNVQQIIDDLQGTCDTLDSAIQYYHPEMDSMDLTEDDHTEIDNQIFLCETCGWWCEISESGDDEGNCKDCAEDDE